MSPPSNQQQIHISPSADGCEPVCVERYDTRVADFAALTPVTSKSQSTPSQGRVTSSSFWRESLTLMEQHLVHGKRRLRVGDSVYLCGESFDTVFLITSGLCKVVNHTTDGRQQPTGPYFKGDWLGFDGIPTGSHGCSAIALDIGEVWTFRYDTLLRVAAVEPMVMRLLMCGMASQLARHRDAILSVNTLSADARVADFLLQWAQSLEERGLRTDQIHIHMTRADMGCYTGLTLESVSRALSKLARCGVIQFNEKGRRDISIPDLAALSNFIQCSIDPATPLLH